MIKLNKKLTIVIILIVFTLLLTSLVSASTEIDDKRLENIKVGDVF